MPIFVIYDDPADFPGKIVVREGRILTSDQKFEGLVFNCRGDQFVCGNPGEGFHISHETPTMAEGAMPGAS